MTETTSNETECAGLARALLTLWPAGEHSIYWDEATSSTHEHREAGRFEFSPGYLDHTTFYVDVRSGAFQVAVKRLDNYKLHERARFIDSTMDNDDWVELQTILSRMLKQFRALKAFETLDLETAWRKLMEALFYGPHLGEPPENMPALKRSPAAVASAVQAVLEEAGRLASFEWRMWDDEGVVAMRAFAPLQALEATLPYPAEDEAEEVRESDHFYYSVLGWFDAQLAQYGLTVVALSPLDEYQNFALVSVENLGELQSAMQTLCIDFTAAPGYLDDE